MVHFRRYKYEQSYFMPNISTPRINTEITFAYIYNFYFIYRNFHIFIAIKILIKFI